MTERVPRLRVERLVIVESRSPLSFVRDVQLHAGLNIVWAQELAAEEGASDVERAAHGVGKSTFCLMLRAVLGDDGASVRTMRSHLAEYYGSGGIAAEVVVPGERFAVFRAYDSGSFAVPNGTVEHLFAGEITRKLEFEDYLSVLGERSCLAHLQSQVVSPAKGEVRWRDFLPWFARDQSLGLCRYFGWRDGQEGKDNPAIVRLGLGLLTNDEARADEHISTINRELRSARRSLRAEEQRGANVREIVETQLRTWVGVSNSLQMVAEDLFADSVEREIQRKTRQIEAKNDEDRAAVAALDRELIELASDIKTRAPIVELAKGRWDEAIALRTNDDKSLTEIRERRDKLLQLVGSCQYGGVSYSECSYVQEQRGTVKLSAQKEIGVLKKSVEELEEREATYKANYDREAKVLEGLATAQHQKTERKKALNKAIEERQRQLGQGDAVRKTLSEWQESQKAPETEKLRTSRANVIELERKLEGAKGAKVSARQQVSDREREVNARFAKLAEVFGAIGRYVPADEQRPFHMLRADGDAYTVLEILLGDLACAANGADGSGAHPGFLIFDCPREREMSPQLYDRLLKLVDEVCKAVPGLQVVLTTTTPPPDPLREPPTRILKLSHASDDDLLLKRRIENLLSRGERSPAEERS